MILTEFGIIIDENKKRYIFDKWIAEFEKSENPNHRIEYDAKDDKFLVHRYNDVEELILPKNISIETVEKLQNAAKLGEINKNQEELFAKVTDEGIFPRDTPSINTYYRLLVKKINDEKELEAQSTGAKIGAWVTGLPILGYGCSCLLGLTDPHALPVCIAILAAMGWMCCIYTLEKLPEQMGKDQLETYEVEFDGLKKYKDPIIRRNSEEFNIRQWEKELYRQMGIFDMLTIDFPEGEKDSYANTLDNIVRPFLCKKSAINREFEDVEIIGKDEKANKNCMEAIEKVKELNNRVYERAIQLGIATSAINLSDEKEEAIVYSRKQ